jgi:hypothetical protein
VSTTLVAVGTILEVFGAALVAAPEIAPPLTRLTRKLLASKLATRVRLLIRGRRHYVMDASPAAYEIKLASRTSGKTSVPDDASDERKLKWLLTQARETEERLGTIERQVEEEPKRRQEEIENLRREFEEHVASTVRRESELYLTLRRSGVVLVIVGVILTAIGNFV